VFFILNASYFRDIIEKWVFLTIFILAYILFLYCFYCFSYSESCHPNYTLLKNNKKAQWELKPATTGRV
jgi:hypothetical protein